MMTIEKAYEKLYKLLEQIDNSKGNKRMQICTSVNR